MDVQTQSQVSWLYLCTLLQYWEDEVAILEGNLFGGHTQRPSAMVLYIMAQVNPGLEEGFHVKWASIVGTPLGLPSSSMPVRKNCSGSIANQHWTCHQNWSWLLKRCGHRLTEEAARTDPGKQSMAPSQAVEAQSQKESPERQQQPPAESEGLATQIPAWP